MSITLPPRAGATWAKVEDGFYVGSRDGAFLGYIDEESNGRYVASNMYSHTIGEYDALEDAIQAIDEEYNAREEPQEGN
ncbi:hypothetical protein [Leucobacter sp. USHLN154]|uniref:hypothetical protein n=1 Tax=Leucobacter sp. USHLN154 TaxID=3081269 RepID=UPI00301733F6